MRTSRAEYTERERLRDLLFAYPEGCDETRTTPINRIDYVYTRREWMQETVRNCGRVGIALSNHIYDVAFMTDKQLQSQRKPKHVVTWYDCGEELTTQLLNTAHT